VPVGLRFFLDYRGNEIASIIKFPLSMGATKIYQARDLVGDFIPARRNSDGVLGMYDTVTQTFLTNGGTGDFIAGPVVQ